MPHMAKLCLLSLLLFKCGVHIRLKSIEEKVQQCLFLHHEGEWWDFRREWHHEDFRLLHDIICMSNQIVDEDGLIIIGVDEENDFQVSDVTDNEERRNTQQLVDFC